jgi:hypothetical protein
VTLKTIDEDGESQGEPTESTVRANPVDQRVRIHYKDGGKNVEVFYDGTLYEHPVGTDEVFRGESSLLPSDVNISYSPIAYYAIDVLMLDFLRRVKMESEGTTTDQGYRVINYDVIGLREDVNINDNVEFDGVEGSVSVTDGGGILSIRYIPKFEGDNITLQSFSYNLSKISGTEVLRPDWLI